MAPQAREFLAEASQFRLGSLPSESRHPRTARLSQLSREDLGRAIRLLNELDLAAVRVVSDHIHEIEKMAEEIHRTLLSGDRIFLCGCGATGRLSVVLETLWRQQCARLGESEFADRLVSFIAGGDFALVRSIENFEDHPEYGARQLQDLRFSSRDLLISTTEGGETPFVIGATEEAARLSKRRPYFLFCNPADILSKTVLRSKRVIENPLIRKISLPTGPMALTGSTRMQATTALMLAVGAALFSMAEIQGPQDQFSTGKFVDLFSKLLRKTPFESLQSLIQEESLIYSKGEYCIHESVEHGITVLTDTTERTPTFSLLPFESTTDSDSRLSWTYLSIPDTATPEEAWGRILGRSPRAIQWPEYQQFGIEKTLSYDFSRSSVDRRVLQIGEAKNHIFRVQGLEKKLSLSLNGKDTRFERPSSILLEHLLLKCILNISSTLVMGRLGRFQGNLMLYVRPTNKKLIDRSLRFVRILLNEIGIHESDEKICATLFETFEQISQDEPVVLRTFEKLRDQMRLSG